MPDGKHLIIRVPRLSCPEILFRPEIIGKNMMMIKEMIFIMV